MVRRNQAVQLVVTATIEMGLERGAGFWEKAVGLVSSMSKRQLRKFTHRNMREKGKGTEFRGKRGEQ